MVPEKHDNQSSYSVFKYEGIQQIYCRWTAEEDKLLKDGVAEFGTRKWTSVSKKIPGRTAIQCSTRWFGALNPSIHKGKWSKAEDEALREAVDVYQNLADNESGQLPWNLISENVPHRNGIQCQARWTETLDPNIRKGRWNPNEDLLLHEAKKRYGSCWVRVASMIPTRTQRQCRTRWNQIYSQQIKSAQQDQIRLQQQQQQQKQQQQQQQQQQKFHDLNFDISHFDSEYSSPSSSSLPASLPKPEFALENKVKCPTNTKLTKNSMLEPINTYLPLVIDDILKQPQEPFSFSPVYSSSSMYSFDDLLASPDILSSFPNNNKPSPDYLNNINRFPFHHDINLDISRSSFSTSSDMSLS